MRAPLVSRTLHKWLALVAGLQLVVWSASGFYMVVVDLDFIHGDLLVRNVRVPLGDGVPAISVAQLAGQYPQVTRIGLRSLPTFDAPAYEISSEGRTILIDAATGSRISPLPEGAIQTLARAYYAGRGELASATLIRSDPPTELGRRALPLWRIDFDDWLNTSLYLHPDTGVLVTRRHRFWRWFDFLWMLHIMDYDARENVNNGLLRAATVLGTTTVLSGAWLLFFSFRNRRT